MNGSSRHALLFLLVFLLLVTSAGGCYIAWVKQQENWQELQRLNRQVSASTQQSISRSAELERKLDMLKKTSELPEVEAFDPARWLSAIKGVSLAAVDPLSVRARVLTDSLEVLDRRGDQVVVTVPIEFELKVSHQAAGVLAVARYGDALGAYSSIESCRLQVVQQLSVKQGLRLRCRVLKVAIQKVSS